ncbi:four helix bundle protein [Candidatus Peribacteria bacterium]|jgi:four helix bundle protein|nr:four helix bundle protein [Candidatus Peribacteria bacterium]MBT4021227.1 four helix bundle protein [Candidatus Peribacteria bacterium]MBT4240697.1 four helix bundle protein [Candidatus Peribacteria bacterium]MBT4473950.1 four helix bundle protein [Candidatus Peribacteria bacterium]
MEKSNPLREKSYKFAVEATLFCRKLIKEDKEFILSKQLLRSATSVGANIEEANFASSKRDFAAKLAISFKEANESLYWLRLIRDSKCSNDENIPNLIKMANELIRLLTSILKTTKQSLAK